MWTLLFKISCFLKFTMWICVWTFWEFNRPLQCSIILTLCCCSLVAQTVKCLPAVRETQVRSLGWEDPLEKEMATHSSTLAWKIPWTEEPGGLQYMGSQRVGHNWATSLHLQCTVILMLCWGNFSSIFFITKFLPSIILCSFSLRSTSGSLD